MSIVAAMPLERSAHEEPSIECRVYQRHACELPTSCQPASAAEMREKRWSATICDLSQGGLALQLQRRYEKGAALAVELPGEGDREPSMVFVKVMHVKRLADGAWKLGCRFISELSDDNVHRLVSPESEDSSCPVPTDAKTSYTNVRVEVEDRSGAAFKLTIKQLNVAKSHLVISGQQLRITGGASYGKNWSFQLEVDYLKSEGDHWKLHGFLVQPITVAELVHAIKLGKQAS